MNESQKRCKKETLDCLTDETGLVFGQGNREALYTQVDWLKATHVMATLENGDYWYGAILCTMIHELNTFLV